MVLWLPSIRYPPAQDGYWSPVTSTLNWCEEDYYATIYSAEIVNTLTNLLFVWLAIKGIRNCLQNGHDTVFVVTFAGYLVVGIGSFLFHSTLKYPMQLVDELSMIYTTCLSLYVTFSYRESKLYGWTLGLSLTALALFISGYYHYLQDPTFHQNMYALLTAILLFRMMYIMEVNIRPSLRDKQRAVKSRERNGTINNPREAEEQREDKRDEAVLRTMWIMIACGLGVFLGGFAIWTLDNEFCPTLRRWRRQIGLPWGILLEGHGWWHLMTGTGAYFYITWGIWLRHCLNRRQDEYELVWPRVFTSLPAVVRRNSVSPKSIQNGVAKKSL